MKEFEPDQAEWPNMFAGEEYPLNYIFTRDPEIGVVGYFVLQARAGNEVKATIKKPLYWDGEQIWELRNGKQGS